MKSCRVDLKCRLCKLYFLIKKNLVILHCNVSRKFQVACWFPFSEKWKLKFINVLNTIGINSCIRYLSDKFKGNTQLPLKADKLARLHTAYHSLQSSGIKIIQLSQMLVNRDLSAAWTWFHPYAAGKKTYNRQPHLPQRSGHTTESRGRLSLENEQPKASLTCMHDAVQTAAKFNI